MFFTVSAGFLLKTGGSRAKIYLLVGGFLQQASLFYR
jgi:hypothetical protein